MALAWLARGEGHALVDYLPEAFQSVPNLPTIARMQQALASLAAVPLPQWLQDAVGGGWVGQGSFRLCLQDVPCAGHPAMPLGREGGPPMPSAVVLCGHAGCRHCAPAPAIRCPRHASTLTRARCAFPPPNPAVLLQVDFAIDSLSELLGALLPPVSGGYWGTLMGLTAAVMLPLAAARADPDFAKGAIPMIATVFVSSMFVFGILTPSIGMHLFWTEASWLNAAAARRSRQQRRAPCVRTCVPAPGRRGACAACPRCLVPRPAPTASWGPSFRPQVVLGYFKIACVAAAANLVSGTLICVRSAHDDLRRGCAALLRAQGICISRWAGRGGVEGRRERGRQAWGSATGQPL